MLLAIFEAYNAAPGFCRPFREGERLLNSGLVIAVGIKEKKGDLLHIQALVLRTSGLASKTPCTVDIHIDKSKPEGSRVVKDSSPECDCPAGLSAKCKDIVAVLLHLARVEESELEDLSCTDLESQWGSMKATTLKQYKGRPSSELCHVRPMKYSAKVPTEEMKQQWREKTVKCTVNSEFTLFTSYSRVGQSSGDTQDEEVKCILLERKIRIERLLTFASWSVLGRLKEITRLTFQTLNPALQAFYKKHVELSLDQCIAIACAPQGTEEWLQCRRVRLTASTARAQYTYYFNPRADWVSRYNSLCKDFKGNVHTLARLRGETKARALYEKTHGLRVLETGLLVRPELPWLGASLDGTVLDEQGWFRNIIEIKTTKERQYMSASELLPHLKSMDETGTVKETHEHYTQMQIGMLLTGIDTCQYIMYSEHGEDAIVSSVKFNPSFTLDLCGILHHVYFEKFLPIMANVSADT